MFFYTAVLPFVQKMGLFGQKSEKPNFAYPVIKYGLAHMDIVRKMLIIYVFNFADLRPSRL
jgi:hypothetical protein